MAMAPGPGQCWSRLRARDHGFPVAQSHTHGMLLSSAPRGTRHMDHAPAIWRPDGDRVTAVRKSPAPGIRYRVAAGRSHRPRSTRRIQARRAFLAVTHRYKRTHFLWPEQFQIVDSALEDHQGASVMRGAHISHSSAQPIPWSTAARKRVTGLRTIGC